MVLAIGANFTGLSLIVARFGVARPDLDVLFFVIDDPATTTSLFRSSASEACYFRS